MARLNWWSRRSFAKAVAGGLLAVAVAPGCRPGRRLGLDDRAGLEPGGWLEVHPDGGVHLLVGATELGQGIHTALAMIVADEIGLAGHEVSVAMSPADEAFANPLMERQRTAWSASVRGWWTPLRMAAATVRQRLLETAAHDWDVPVAECELAEGILHHRPSGRSASIAAVAPRAATVPLKGRPELRPPAQYRLIGRGMARVDVPAKVTGQTRYSGDIRLPNLHFASLLRPPGPGFQLSGFASAAAAAVPGVVSIDESPVGVAVVASSSWAALMGRAALGARWERNEGPEPAADQVARLRALLAPDRQETLVDRGGAARRLSGASRTVRAEYVLPYLAHAPMEPACCTAVIEAGACRVWAATQDQTTATAAAAAAAGVDPSRVELITPPLGGGFGERVHPDLVTEAVTLAVRTRRAIQLVSSREDEFARDRFRPMSCHQLEAALDDAGRLIAWRHRIAGGGGEGATAPPYRPDHLLVSYSTTPHELPVGIWRAVDHSYNAFAVESFIDEVALEAGRDPVDFRLSLLDASPRHRAVLAAASEAAGWAAPLPEGRARGVAVHAMVESVVAVVVEVEVLPSGGVSVVRVTAAVDCGRVINPDGVRAQIEGSVVMGLSAATGEEITLREGRLVQTNFDRYPLLRMADSPAIETILLDGGADPGGVGEVGLPPVAPALANAMARLGRRPRVLPIRLGGG